MDVKNKQRQVSRQVPRKKATDVPTYILTKFVPQSAKFSSTKLLERSSFVCLLLVTCDPFSLFASYFSYSSCYRPFVLRHRPDRNSMLAVCLIQNCSYLRCSVTIGLVKLASSLEVKCQETFDVTLYGQRSKVQFMGKQFTKIPMLTRDVFPIHLRLLRQRRYRPCLRPVYFLLRLNESYLTETCMLWLW